MSPSEQPPRPSAHSSETPEASGLAHHNEFVEDQQGSACRHIAERLTAYALLGTACAITALSIYAKLEGGDFLPITGFAPLMAFGSEAILTTIDRLETKYKRER